MNLRLSLTLSLFRVALIKNVPLFDQRVESLVLARL